MLEITGICVAVVVVVVVVGDEDGDTIGDTTPSESNNWVPGSLIWGSGFGKESSLSGEGTPEAGTSIFI